jgi:hypothetical protein
MTFYFLSFIGAQARELVLKADALLTHDPHSQLTGQLKTSKSFLVENLIYLFNLFADLIQLHQAHTNSSTFPLNQMKPNN